MGHVKNIVAFRLVRFLIVGAGNTAVNFAVLNFAFYGLHQGKLVSSFVATACAVVFSFILNRAYVFVDKDRPAKKLALFIIVTVSGVMLIQNSVYDVGIHLLHGHELGVINAIHSIIGVHLSSNFVDVNLSNLVASILIMFWNYNGYRVLVFRGKRHGDEIIEDEAIETA